MVTEPSPQQARKEEVAALPRPSQVAGKTSAEISADARKVARQDDLWKVYRREWIRHFTGTEEDARLHFEARFAGRVEDEHVAYRTNPHTGLTVLELAIWNYVGEFKTRELAEEFAGTLSDGTRVFSPLELEIVGRNSPEEARLKGYSVKKIIDPLAAAKRAVRQAD